MIAKVCAMYFSGTGTSEKIVTSVARTMADELDAKYEVFDFTPLAARSAPKTFDEGDVVVLGVPVIAGRVPNLLLKYLESLQGCGALGVPVVCFGNRNYDDALIELRDIMETDGFHTVAGGAFSCEHSFSTILGKGRPDAKDLREAKAFAKAAADKIRSGKIPYGAIPVKGETPIRPYYTPRDRNGNAIDIRKVKPKTNDKCTKCGLCVSLCPLGSISSEDPSQIPGICMKCCACVKKCPVGAKYFDDEGYLYHKKELEELYGGRRAQNNLFV